MQKPKIKAEYNLLVEMKIGIREGSGMAMTVQDLIRIFRYAGYYAEQLPSTKEKINIFVSPPRHLVTGEDLKLTKEEKGNQNDICK